MGKRGDTFSAALRTQTDVIPLPFMVYFLLSRP